MKVTRYGNDIVIVKLENRRILIVKSNDTFSIVFKSLQDESELNNSYWDEVLKTGFGKCVSKKIVRISNEAAKALIQSLAILIHPNAQNIIITPKSINL